MKGKKIKQRDVDAAIALLAAMRGEMSATERELCEKVSQVTPDMLATFAITHTQYVELKTLEILFASNIYHYNHPNRK